MFGCVNRLNSSVTFLLTDTLKMKTALAALVRACGKHEQRKLALYGFRLEWSQSEVDWTSLEQRATKRFSSLLYVNLFTSVHQRKVVYFHHAHLSFFQCLSLLLSQFTLIHT